jgi:putative ABC transport system permease protein
LVEGVWIDPAHPECRGAVIGKGVAEQMNLKVGDEALLIVGPKEFRLVIAGLIEEGPSQMGMMRRSPSANAAAPTGIEAGPARSAVYVPLELARHFSRGKAKVNIINVRLNSSSRAQADKFRATWERQIARSRPLASILGVSDIRTNIEEGMMASRAKQEAWAATGLSLLAALFIIFTTLSMGVTERVRQFAILRAAGLTRSQVARVIAIEAVLLALIGWGGGLLAGWGLLAVASQWQPSLFRNGVSLGTWCILLTGISAVGGAILAAILPAWRAMRVEPLDAMSHSRYARPRTSWTVAFAVAGLICIAVNPTLVYVASATLSTDNLYYVYMAVGCTTMAVGFLLLTPAAIIFVERVGGPFVAWIFALEPRLLRSLLSGNQWHTLGTTAALSVGLGLFAAMQIWGYSMLEPFKPGAWNPDMLVAIQRGGLPDSEMASIRAIEGIRPGRCIPLAVEQPRLASDITQSEEHQSVICQNNVIMIGLDPEIAFGGNDPLVKVRFVEGNSAECIKRLKAGGNCIVPDHFLRATNLKLGDRFSMIVPESPSQRVEYTIVGAVSLPGWHWMTKFSGLRRREGRSSAIVFADYDTVRRDFELKQINFLWMDVDEAFGAKHLDEVIKAEEKRQAAAPKTGPGSLTVKTVIDPKRAAVVKIGEALRPIAERNTGDEQPVNGQGRWPMGATMFGDSVRVSTPEQVHSFITARAEGMIWASCYLPLITLAVTSLGVVNTVMASVRARQWEFGILRSQGVTRSGLFRMVLAEGLLIGVTTCILSLVFGGFSGWCGTGISQHVSFFGGLAPLLVLPWAQLSIGFGMALGLCLVAALVPAILTARAEPLRLLQAGRAAM